MTTQSHILDPKLWHECITRLEAEHPLRRAHPPPPLPHPVHPSPSVLFTKGDFFLEPPGAEAPPPLRRASTDPDHPQVARKQFHIAAAPLSSTVKLRLFSPPLPPLQVGQVMRYSPAAYCGGWTRCWLRRSRREALPPPPPLPPPPASGAESSPAASICSRPCPWASAAAAAARAAAAWAGPVKRELPPPREGMPPPGGPCCACCCCCCCRPCWGCPCCCGGGCCPFARCAACRCCRALRRRSCT